MQQDGHSYKMFVVAEITCIMRGDTLKVKNSDIPYLRKQYAFEIFTNNIEIEQLPTKGKYLSFVSDLNLYFCFLLYAIFK